MEDKPLLTYACRNCGAPITEGLHGLCPRCAQIETDSLVGDARPDYDNSRAGGFPPWSTLAAIGVWLFSVAAILLLPNIIVGAWLVLAKLLGTPVATNQGEFARWIASPRVVLASVLSLLIAHLLTIAVCWMVVTGYGRRPFFATLGWGWPSRSPASNAAFVIAVVFVMYAVTDLIARFLPPSRQTLFDQLLKTSSQVRIAVAFLAVFTAPFVEEVVYRGLLYPALKTKVGVVASVLIVTLLFSAVHFPQYWGAWSTLAGLTLLSFTLTIIRACIKLVLPCVAIHALFNAIGAIIIIIRGAA
jgi:membrane protease YdiL (CAAX protease family)